MSMVVSPPPPLNDCTVCFFIGRFCAGLRCDGLAQQQRCCSHSAHDMCHVPVDAAGLIQIPARLSHAKVYFHIACPPVPDTMRSPFVLSSRA